MNAKKKKCQLATQFAFMPTMLKRAKFEKFGTKSAKLATLLNNSEPSDNMDKKKTTHTTSVSGERST